MGVITARLVGASGPTALPVPTVGQTVANVVALRALVGSTALPAVGLQQYSTRDFVGGGMFIWDASAKTDDGWSRFNAGGIGSSGAGWQRIPPVRVNAHEVGVVADGVTDDTAALQAAMERAQENNFGGAPYSMLEVWLPNGRIRTTATVEMSSYTALRSNYHTSIVPDTHDFPVLRIGGSNNVIEGVWFDGGLHAVALFGASVVWGGTIGTPANAQSVVRFTDCIFWNQRGPSIWQDTSYAGQDRSAACHIVIEKFNHRGGVLWWGTADGLTIKDGWSQVDNATYPVAWDDAKKMGWLCSHGVVSIQDVSCAPLDANGSWYEGAGIVQSRGWRLGGEFSRVPWRLRKGTMEYGGYALPLATTHQLPRVFSDEDAIASTNTGHLAEIYDVFPSRIVIRRPVPFDQDASRTDSEFATSAQSIWVDSVSCPSSGWAGGSKNSLGLVFETDFQPRIVTSADPTAEPWDDVTHLLAHHTERKGPRPAAPTGRPALNTWPDAAGSGGGGMRYDPSWGYGATGTNIARSTDSTLGVDVDAIVGNDVSGCFFYWTSGASTGPDVNWGSGLPAGVYTCSVFVKANFAGELQFSINGGTSSIAWLRFEDSAGEWQRMAVTFYHDGTDRRLMWSCYNIPGTGQPGGAGSIALGLPMVHAGTAPAPYAGPGLTAPRFTTGRLAPGSESFGDGQWHIQYQRLQLTSTQRLTLAGTARYIITDL